jgi:hypothetical protein
MGLDGTIVASVIGATGAKASRGAAAVVEAVLQKAGITAGAACHQRRHRLRPRGHP